MIDDSEVLAEWIHGDVRVTRAEAIFMYPIESRSLSFLKAGFFPLFFKKKSVSAALRGNLVQVWQMDMS